MVGIYGCKSKQPHSMDDRFKTCWPTGLLALSPPTRCCCFSLLVARHQGAALPLHTWLRTRTSRAADGRLVMLAGVMLKMGTYGMIASDMPLFRALSPRADRWVAADWHHGIITARWGMVQPNLKKAGGRLVRAATRLRGAREYRVPPNISMHGAVYQMLRAWSFHRRSLLAGGHGVRPTRHV